jgi:phosphatidylethanolamine N-methyltransferase
MEFLKENVNVLEKNFIETVGFTLISMLSFCLLPHLQHKYKILSKMTNNDMGRAADFLAYFLIHIGTFKNYAFFETLYNNKQIVVGSWYYYTIIPLGMLSTILGAILVIFSFQRLGLRGMYFGDHFGFLFNRPIVSFPYNYLENPQYVGNNLCYFGLSLIFRSPAGLVLTFFMILMYRLLWDFMEKKKLKEFYPEYDSDDTTCSIGSKLSK